MRRLAWAPRVAVRRNRRPAASGQHLANVNVGGLAQNFSIEEWARNLNLGKEPEVASYANKVYLVTLSRVLSSTLASRPDLRGPGTLDREEICRALFDAFEIPMVKSRGGRPRPEDGGPRILKSLVAKLFGADVTLHVHVGIELASQQRFRAAKRALLEQHGLVEKAGSVGCRLNSPTLRPPSADPRLGFSMSI